jgi:arginase
LTVASRFATAGTRPWLWGKRLAPVVRRAIEAGQFPLVLAGGCDASKGILSGFDHGHCGVVWFDPHGDFNTPETTISGYLDAE